MKNKDFHSCNASIQWPRKGLYIAGHRERRPNLSFDDAYIGRKIWRKLVRDRIPEIISADGKVAVTRTLDDADMDMALKDKLLEECTEVRVAMNREDLEKKLSDVLEVIYALAAHAGLTPEGIERVRKRRAAERGGFSRQIWLEETLPTHMTHYISQQGRPFLNFAPCLVGPQLCSPYSSALVSLRPLHWSSIGRQTLRNGENGPTT